MLLKDSRAVSEFLRNAADGKDILLKSAGLVERSHCYVFDAASAILQVLTHGERGKSYNIADGQYQMTIREFAQRAALAGGTKVKYLHPTDVEARGYSNISRSVLDNSRLLGLGWKPRYSNPSAIEETVSILREIQTI